MYPNSALIASSSLLSMAANSTNPNFRKAERYGLILLFIAASSLLLTACYGTSYPIATQESVSQSRPQITEVAPSPTTHLQEVYSPDLILDTNESAALEPTQPEAPQPQPTPNETQELEVVGSVQIEEQEGEFDLIDPKLGQEVAAFDNLDQLGYAETRDGRWVIFDKETRLAIETMKRTDLERLDILPELRPINALVRLYYANGFFVNYREEELPYDPVAQNSEKINIGVIRIFVPKDNNKGVFIDVYIIDNTFDFAPEFEDPSLVQGGFLPRTVEEILRELSTGTYLRLKTEHGGDRLDHFPYSDNLSDSVSKFAKFERGHREMNSLAYEQFLQDEDIIDAGPTYAINYFTIDEDK